MADTVVEGVEEKTKWEGNEVGSGLPMLNGLPTRLLNPLMTNGVANVSAAAVAAGGNDGAASADDEITAVAAEEDEEEMEEEPEF